MRTLPLLFALLPCLGCQSPPAPALATTPRNAEVPTAAQTAAIAALRERWERAPTTTASAVLADAGHRDLHDQTPFRELVAAHATAAPLTLVDRDEPGTPFVVHGRVLDPAGAAVADALVYAYHTDARGFYGYDRAHVGGNEGDLRHARLFGYVRTDRDGRFELHTIRPASYPDTELPQHVHVQVTHPRFAPLVTEVMFADDPKLTSKQREQAQRSGFQVVAVDVSKDRVERCGPVFTLRSAK